MQDADGEGDVEGLGGIREWLPWPYSPVFGPWVLLPGDVDQLGGDVHPGQPPDAALQEAVGLARPATDVQEGQPGRIADPMGDERKQGPDLGPGEEVELGPSERDRPLDRLAVAGVVSVEFRWGPVWH